MNPAVFTDTTTEQVKNKQANWSTLCQLNELVDNVGVCALLDNKQIALFKLSNHEQIHALDNYDPFSHANVLSRGVVGDIGGVPVVASPIYKQHFILATGQCLEDERVKLTTYSTRVVNGVVQITLD